MQNLTIALVGNPNSGKSSVFNLLTGLRQKVGNFPGVTVEKKTGNIQLEKTAITLVDLPGTYSLYPTSKDERVVAQVLCNPTDKLYPDAIIYIANVVDLEKHLLLFTQIRDLGLPTILALNMADVAEQKGLKVDIKQLKKSLQTEVVLISGRTGQGIDDLKNAIVDLRNNAKKFIAPTSFYPLTPTEKQLNKDLEATVQQNSWNGIFENANEYRNILLAHHHEWLPFLGDQQKEKIAQLCAKNEFKDLNFQVNETMKRYDLFVPIVRKSLQQPPQSTNNLTDKIDDIVTHKVLGPFIFFLLMLLVFQAIYSWSSYPMDWIEGAFGWMSTQARVLLPEGWMADLVADGILAGLGGILIFIPQIAILFLLISILEEIGYMARAVFMFDKLMQRFGLNGRSVVALISGGACAIPAVMSTRTIANWKERLITIMVTPLISCSARIPVYTLLIGFVVPSATVWGIFNLQGLAFMGLYVLGIVAALVSAWIFKLILKSDESSFLMIELPQYRQPMLRNVLLNVYEKVKTFTIEAGKVIFVISIILWVLASYGPGNQMQLAEQQAIELAQQQQLDEEATADLVASQQLEASYAGHLGKFIEPVIRPLGFDWKIGIALITSFAAREVFVGTMATIYSIGSVEDELTIRDQMAKEKNPVTGEPVYSLATALSLLIFYVFAMQCMSTLAVVRRETNSWKWPMLQLAYMTILAYLGSFMVYNIF